MNSMQTNFIGVQAAASNKLHSMGDSELLLRTKDAVKEERKLMLEVLHLLREVDRRRLYAMLGFSSLYEYAIKELAYSGGAAHRRIEAMRLLREVPEVESKLADGALNLSTLSTVQSFLKEEKKQNHKTYTQQEKHDLLEKLEGKSTREAEKLLATVSPQAMIGKLERERAVSATQTEIKIVLDDELKKMLERARDLIACPQNPNPTYAVIFEKLAKFYLDKKDPLRKLPSSESATSEIDEAEAMAPAPGPQSIKTETTPPKNPHSRYIKTNYKHQLFQRANGQCEYVDQNTGRRCQATRGLQVDHIKPHACNGSNELSNLSLACPMHNQLRAIKYFGAHKMSRYVPALE